MRGVIDACCSRKPRVLELNSVVSNYIQDLKKKENDVAEPSLSPKKIQESILGVRPLLL